MRVGRKLFGLCLALCLALLSAAPVKLQAAGEAYTYTVRFFAGAQGSIDGQELVEYRECRPGERISFSQSRVSLKDNSKYYIRGIRESGRDNDEILAAASFEVTEDADYVVAYGILGDAVMYTVEYVDEAGNPLAPSETYYGNVGDRPVVAFAYIEGYQPQAYNLTGTLDADASRNVFRFTYTSTAREQGPRPEDGTGTGTGAGQTPGETPAEPPAQPGQEPGETPEGQEPEEAGGEEADPGTEIADDLVPLAEPEEIQDINDDEIPLAEGSGPMENPVQANGFARLIGNIPLAAKLLIGAAAAAAVAAAWFFLMHRRRKASVKTAGKAGAEERKGKKGPKD